MDVPFKSYAPQLVAVIVAAAIIADLIIVAKNLFPSRMVVHKVAPMSIRAKGASDADAALVIASHLFGMAESPPGVALQTAQRLVLAGTIATETPHVGFGILGDSAQSARVYAVGALVAEDTRLYEVYSDHVMLEHRGQVATVRFKQGPREPSLAAHQGVQVADDGAAGDEQAAPTKADSLLATLNAYPTWDGGGQFVGYQMNPSPKARRQFGLRAGDHLVTINGTEISSPNDVEEATLQKSDETTITIERDGQRVALALHIGGS